MGDVLLKNQLKRRSARKKWNQKRASNQTRVSRRLDALRRLIDRASPTMQELASESGIELRELCANVDPQLGVVRSRMDIKPARRQIGPESLQWLDLRLRWGTSGADRIRQLICSNWHKRIRAVVNFLKKAKLDQHLDELTESDAVMVCRLVREGVSNAQVARLLGDMRFQSGWLQLGNDLLRHLEQAKCDLCSSPTPAGTRLCDDCHRSSSSFGTFSVLWKFAGASTGTDLLRWRNLMERACRAAAHEQFSDRTLAYLESRITKEIREPVDQLSVAYVLSLLPAAQACSTFNDPSIEDSESRRGRTDVSATNTIAARDDLTVGVFRPDGDGYYLQAFGEKGHVSATGTKGLHDIFRLIQKPLQRIPMPELAGGIALDPKHDTWGSSQPAFDEAAHSAILDKISELNWIIENPPSIEELQSAQDHLDELNAYLKKGHIPKSLIDGAAKGAVRNLNSGNDKLRSRISSRISAACEKLTNYKPVSFPKTASHFRSQIHAVDGYFFHYAPSPIMNWRID